jgi:hypothetical protein
MLTWRLWREIMLVAVLLTGLALATPRQARAQPEQQFPLELRIQAIDPPQERTPITGATFTILDAATGETLITRTSDDTGMVQADVPPPSATDVLITVQGERPDGTALYQDGADIDGYLMPLRDSSTTVPVYFIALPTGQVVPDVALWQGDAHVLPPDDEPPVAVPDTVVSTPPPAPYMGDLWPAAPPTPVLEPTPVQAAAASSDDRAREGAAAPVDPTAGDLLIRLQNNSGRPLPTATVVLHSSSGQQHASLDARGEAVLRFPPDLAAVAAPPVLTVQLTGRLADGTPLTMRGLDAQGIRILPDTGSTEPLRLELLVTEEGVVVPALAMFRDDPDLVTVPGTADLAARQQGALPTPRPSETPSDAPLRATLLPSPTVTASAVRLSSAAQVPSPQAERARSPQPDGAAEARGATALRWAWPGLLAVVVIGGIAALTLWRYRQTSETK